MTNEQKEMNDPRYCGACKHIHPPHEVDCRCYCDKVDCPKCGPRIAQRVVASAVPAGPRCPKCGNEASGYISACRYDGDPDGDYVLLACCGKFPINRAGHPYPVLDDFAQFFSPSPATGQPPQDVSAMARKISNKQHELGRFLDLGELVLLLRGEPNEQSL